MGIEIEQLLNVVSPLTAPFIVKYLKDIETFYANENTTTVDPKVKITTTQTTEVKLDTDPLTTKQKILRVLYYVVNILIGIWAFSISWNVNTHLGYMVILKVLCAVFAYLLAPFYLLFHFMFRYEIIKSYNSIQSSNAISGETPFSLLTRKLSASGTGRTANVMANVRPSNSNYGAKMPNSYIAENSSLR